MSLKDLPVFEIIALLGIVVGPGVAYLAAKRKIKSEVLLIDINTIRGWSAQRKSFENEIAELHQALSDEQDQRRADRERYLLQIDALQMEVSELRERLREYGDT